jgi:hypothetical protein
MTNNINAKKLPLIYFSLSIFSMVAGFMVYYFLRENDLLIYQWFHFLPQNNNTITFSDKSFWLDFLRYNLPDGLWLLSILLFLRAIWHNDQKTFLIYKLCIIVIGFTFEILQVFDAVPGTFDFLDLATMGSIALVESVVHKILLTKEMIMNRRMINHGIAIIGIAIVAFLSVASVTTAPPANSEKKPENAGSAELNFTLALQNPQDYLLYPAVGVAYTNIKKTVGGKLASLWDIDCLDNQFTIRGCVAERKMFDIITYQIKISCQDDQLTVEFINIEEKFDAMQFSDAEVESLPRFDTKKTADQLKADIEQTLANADAYNAAKKVFFENNDFLKRAFVPVTSAMRDEFTATLFKDGEISLNVSILDVKKNENAEFSDYATVISAGLYTSDGISGAFATASLYTNDSSLTRLKQHEKTTISGQLVRMEYNMMGQARFIMTK